MKIRIEEIKDKVLDLSAVEEVAGYPVLAALQEAGECLFLGPLDVQLSVAREYDHIRAQGRVTTKVRLGCSRCLAEYETDIDSPFTVFYMPAAAGVAQDEEVELTEEDLVSATYEGDEIDFAREIAEQVLTEIPVKPLCREDCKGLCPVCGTDLNEAVCNCRKEPFNIKFEALKNIKIEK
ncbi:MAG TPA: DUF177 domain-containing protein [Geobacteraceae bacterium]|nr:DUF177 domain-containing protein [Geobacteraceae bacterium]